MADYEMPKDYIKNKLDYKVINRGKCMLWHGFGISISKEGRKKQEVKQNGTNDILIKTV